MTGDELLKRFAPIPRSETPFIMGTAKSKTENVIAAKRGCRQFIVSRSTRRRWSQVEAVFAEAAESAPAAWA